MNELPACKYNVIYADPPWAYANFKAGTRRQGISWGAAAAHYACMPTAEICALDVQSIADPNSLLFLWATYPNIKDALQVMEAWGFVYKTVGFTWVKTRGKGWYSGLGFYTNGNCEVCLIGRRGKFQRVAKDVKQLVVAPLGKHSQKPPEVRDRIVKLCGNVPRIELFARQHTPGWDVWGDQV